MREHITLCAVLVAFSGACNSSKSGELAERVQIYCDDLSTELQKLVEAARTGKENGPGLAIRLSSEGRNSASQLLFERGNFCANVRSGNEASSLRDRFQVELQRFSEEQSPEYVLQGLEGMRSAIESLNKLKLRD
jgi:hypothetical protein